MKKIPTYMLVRKLQLDAGDKKTDLSAKKDASLKRKTKLARLAISARSLQFGFSQKEQAALNSATSSTKVAKVFTKLSPNFKRTLFKTFITEPIIASGAKAVRKGHVNASVNSIARELARTKNVQRVGILDLGAWISGLPLLLKKLNAVQSPFTIFEIQAPIPAGMLKSREGMNAWAKKQIGKKFKKSDWDDVESHTVADEFFVAAEDIRKSMGLDLIVGMTPAMVAGVDEDGIYLNHFCSVSGKTIVLSTTDLRPFAEKAGRPYEAAVGAILLAALMVAANKKIYYHDDTGCLFDYNESRVSLIKALKKMYIDENCLGLMTVDQRTAALAMLKVLKDMKRGPK